MTLVDVSGVLLGRDRARARPRTETDVEVEARASRRDATLGGQTTPLGAGSSADRDDAADGVDGLARCTRVREGTEVPGARLVLLARELDRGIRVVERHSDERVALVVSVVDVVRRPELPDEVLLEDERLDLVGGDDVVVARDLLHHDRDGGPLVAAGDVLAHALLERLGLAHVEHLAALVLPQVDAWGVGYAAKLLGDRGGVGGLHHSASRRPSWCWRLAWSAGWRRVSGRYRGRDPAPVRPSRPGPAARGRGSARCGSPGRRPRPQASRSR